MSLISRTYDPFLEQYRPPRWWYWDEDDLWSPWANHSRAWMKLGYLRAPYSSSKSTDVQVLVDKDKFQVNVDVQQFAPNEITVKATGDDTIIVEGIHEERPDDHGFVSRRFMRRYVLPRGHDLNEVVSNLSSDGVLTVTVPRSGQSGLEHKTIPITHTGLPSKTIVYEESKK